MNEAIFGALFQEEIYSIPVSPVVVLDTPWSDVAAEDKTLLFKILGATKLSPDAFRIVHQPSFDLSQWNEKPSRLLAFVNPPPGMALYERIEAPGTTLIISEPLAVLAASEPNKRKLWKALQELFPA
ncbi:MAG: hypothetical protein SH819_09750 [Cytophagales bacterium]|nr:hypothetical protein [Cytophagales bacterium]